MIWYSSMITATQLQQSWNDDVLILWDIISENERRITKSESEEVEDELSLDIDEQLTWVMLQCDELRKKQKLAAIQSKIETLQVIEMMKKNHQTFTWVLMKNLNDLCIIFIVSMMMKWSHHKIILQKRKFSMSLKKYHDKIIREHREWIRNVKISFRNISWHFERNKKKILYCMIYLKSESKKLWFNHEKTMYVCNSANVIQFYWLSSEFNRRLNESRHKRDLAICECIATFRSDDTNVCNSFEHSETSTFIV